MPKTAKSWEQSRLTDLKIVYWALVDGLPPPKSKKYIHLFNPISIEGLMTMATLRQEHAQAACGQTKGCLSRKGGQEEVGSGGGGNHLSIPCHGQAGLLRVRSSWVGRRSSSGQGLRAPPQWRPGRTSHAPAPGRVLVPAYLRIPHVNRTEMDFPACFCTYSPGSARASPWGASSP